MSTTSNLHQKAMLVGLAIHGWQARKYDRRISAEVSVAHAATQNAGRYNKHLLPQAAASYEAVHKKGREFRTFYYDNTLPWSKDGQRILPTKNYEQFAEGVRKFKREYKLLTEDFLREYPVLKEDARILLNGMFNESDYPQVEEMRGKFWIDLETLPFPTAEDFRVNLAGNEVDRIRREIEERVRMELDKAGKDLWNRLRTAVDNMILRLSSPESKFHDTLVGNIRDIVDLIPRLNFVEDANLEAVRAKCAETLVVHNPQVLREDVGVRSLVAAQAKEISVMMDAYM